MPEILSGEELTPGEREALNDEVVTEEVMNES